MKKEVKLFKTKRKKKIPLYTFFFLIGIITCFKIIDKKNIDIKNDNLTLYLLDQTTHKENKYIKQILRKQLLTIYEAPTKHLLQNKNNLIKKIKKELPVITIPKQEPIIYIYNTHQTEEYATTSYLEFTIKPSVTMANYILEDIFNKSNFNTIVEEKSIKQILNNNNWSYSNSYKVSRMFMEDAKKNNPTLKYYIDVHRDSVTKDKTTVIINEKPYAKLLFVIGMENSKVQENLLFATEINTCLNEKYPSLSKGIYKKSGAGVNGIYNQDFSPYVVLIEIGGFENTTNEVLNSSIAFSNCFMEVITRYESQRTN